MKSIITGISQRIFLALFLFLIFQNPANAQLVSGNAFLQGMYVEVGSSPLGAFGTTVDAPAGYHPRPYLGSPSGGTGPLGFVADVAVDGWTTGFPDYHGDFFMPGSPHEGWSIASGYTQADAWFDYGFFSGPLTGAQTSVTTTGTDVTNIWDGTFNTDLQIKQTVHLFTDKLYFTIRVDLKNTGTATMPDIYYMRTVDPDNDVSITSEYTTSNEITYALPNPGNNTLVGSTDLYYPEAYLGLGTKDCRAKPYIISYGSLSPLDNIKDIYDGTTFYFYYMNMGDTYTSDVGTGLVFHVGDLAPGDSTSFTYVYILRESDLDEALQSTAPTAMADSAFVNQTDTIDLASCSLADTVNFEILNGTDYTWTWSPATGLSTTTGPNVTATTTGPITYTAIGVGNCGNDTFTFYMAPLSAAPPPVAGSPVTYCQGAIASPLTATGTALLWYTTSTGGVGSSTAPTPSTATAGTTTYYVSQTVGGCESARTPVDVIVNAAVTNSVSVAICAGQTYTWGGTTYSTAGTYTQLFTTEAGCDSTVTLDLTVTSAITDTFDIAICNGGSYLFNGVPLTTTGSYTVTFTSSGGCDSIVTINLTVNPTYNTSFSATICQGDTYTWAGTGYTATGSYPQSFLTTAGCDSSVTLNLLVNDTAHTDIAASICSGQSYLFNGTAYTTTGTYTANLTTVNGCDSNVVLTLTVLPALSSTLDTTVCFGQSVSFAGSTYSTSGTYTATFVVAGGCDSIATLNLTVNPQIITGFVAAICSGSTYTFNGNILTSSGIYTDTLTSAGGCDSVSMLFLTVDSVIVINYYASICAGGTFFFDGSAITVPGVYTDSLVSTGGCDSVVNLTLNVIPLVTTNITGAICQGSFYFFNGMPLGVAGNYSDTLTSSMGCDSVVNLTLTVNPVYNQDIFSTICAGQAYAFGGLYYTTTGLYTFPFISSLGCDSTIYLHLTVLAPIVTDLYDTVCNGQSFSYNGALYSATGDYPSVFTSVSSGCDSTVTLHLLVLPVTPPPAVTDTMLCQGTTSPTLSVPGTGIIWYATEFGPSAISPPVPPTTVPDTITYYVSQTISGCESQRVPFVVTILPKPLAPLVNTPVVYCSGVLADSLHYSVLTTGYDSLIWYPASTGTVVIPEPVPATTMADTFNFWVSQVVDGCASNRSAIEVDVKTTLPAPAVISPLEYCQYSFAPPLTATLADTNAALLWYTAGSTVGSPVTPSPNTSTPAVTTWTVTQTLDGCESPASSITVTIKPKPAPPLVNSLQIYCQGSMGGSVHLTATGSNLLWYTSAGGGTGTPLAPFVSTGMPDTVNWYVSQTVNGCESDRALITVRILTKPDAEIAIDHNPACQFDTLTVTYEGTAPAGADFFWTMAGAQIISPTGGTNNAGPFVITYNTPGTYMINLLVNNHGCSSQADGISVIVKPLPELSFVLSESGCTGTMQDIVLNSTTAGIDEDYTWDFAGGSVIFGAGGGPYGVVWTDTGWHTVTASVSADGCMSHPFVDSIHVSPYPVAEILTVPEIVCTLDSVTLIAQTAPPGEAPYIYHWSPAEWITDSSMGATAIIQANGTGWIYLEVESAPGCTANDSMLIETQACCTVAMPMAFSPNGDGLNDEFRVITAANQDVIFFRILNRWGQEVFETHEENNGWDGTYNGEPQDVDTYYYILQYTCADGSTHEKSGDVTLVR